MNYQQQHPLSKKGLTAEAKGLSLKPSAKEAHDTTSKLNSKPSLLPEETSDFVTDESSEKGTSSVEIDTSIKKVYSPLSHFPPYDILLQEVMSVWNKPPKATSDDSQAIRKQPHDNSSKELAAKPIAVKSKAAQEDNANNMTVMEHAMGTTPVASSSGLAQSAKLQRQHKDLRSICNKAM